VLLPLWSLLDDQPSPPPPEPPRPQDNSFIFVGGGGGGGWPNHEEIERCQREWLADQCAYREHLRAMGMLEGGMVRRARRLPRHTYVSARRVRPRAPTQNPTSTKPALAGAPSKRHTVFHVGELAGSLLPKAGSAIARRYRKRNGSPDVLVASAVGAAGFVGTKVVVHVAAPKIPRPITSVACVTAACLAPSSWAYRQPLIVGASVATIDELLRLIVS
jgi:hypothetical protein